jgi:SAM-dependent methyltransferase
MAKQMTTLDPWTIGAGYEPYIGRWSRRVAREFVTWLAVPAGARWVDIGCGTGALTETILAHANPAAVVGVDASEGYVATARRATAHDPRVRFDVADACTLPYGEATNEAAVSGLVLNFVTEPRRMVKELARVVVAGGTVAAYVWDYASQMQLIRRFWDAAVALDPSARALDEGERFPICARDALAAVWTDSGLANVEVRSVDVPTVFADFDDYWRPFLGGQGPAPGYVMALDEPRRTALRERLCSTLPYERDGSIRLVARAWAVRGSRST